MAVMRKKILKQSPTPVDSNPNHLLETLKQAWFSRAVLIGQNIHHLARRIEFNEDVLTLLDMENMPIDDYKPAIIRKIIRIQARKFADKAEVSLGIENITLIKQVFGFSDIEAQILLLACLIDIDNELAQCFEALPSVNNRQLAHLLHKMLKVPEQAIVEAINKRGLLAKTGLLKVNPDSETLPDKLILLKGISSTLLDSVDQPIEALFADYVIPAKPTKLSAQDFHYLKTPYHRLVAYLKHATKTRQTGCNILVYGPPGTGKTQMVRTIAAELDLSLYEVSAENADGNTLAGKERISACQLAQHLLQGKNDKCLLFDEIEDIFSDSLAELFLGQQQSTGHEKAWVNQLLENNRVPTFWLSNSIKQIDPAFIRRFDIVMEMPIPPASIRKKMLHQATSGLNVGEQWLDSVANLQSLSPGIIARAAKVTRMLGEKQAKANETHLKELIESTLKAMGHDATIKQTCQHTRYDPDLVNTSLNINKISAGLKRTQQGRLCLYGPPGTGKSAYAAHLSEYLGKPLLTRRASDIMDCYVGNTEKNIADMFAQAKAENALLLLDEADSFLQNRQQSKHSWEVTQVNELLVQMENFDGVFICSTNLMDSLDSAVLRRFDFKLKFDYLKPQQAWALLNQIMEAALKRESTANKKRYQQQLAAMDYLTPGDFIAVKRKLAVLGETKDIPLFLQNLQEELSFKPEGRSRSIGFAAVI